LTFTDWHGEIDAKALTFCRLKEGMQKKRQNLEFPFFAKRERDGRRNKMMRKGFLGGE